MPDANPVENSLGQAAGTRHAAWMELGLMPGADDNAIRSAFRARLKESHPDLTGGSDVALRRIILARDLLMADNRTSVAGARWLKDLAHTGRDSDGAIQLNITLHQAIYGGEATQDLHALEISPPEEEVTSLSQMKTLSISLPAGLRENDRLRLSIEGAPRPEQLFRIHIATENGARVDGNDIHIIGRIESRILFAGGPAIIDTPHGPREIFVTRGTQDMVVKGLGLPATDQHASGDLHIHLEAGVSTRRPWTEAMGEFRQKWAS